MMPRCLMSTSLLTALLAGALLLPVATAEQLAEQIVVEPAMADPQALLMVEMDPVERVQKAGLMAGFPDGQFHAEKSVTRAELAKILVDAFNVKQRQTPELKQVSVTDVPETFWAHDAIYTALGHGLMEGYRQGRFFPNHPVTRGEGFAIFAQGYGVLQFEP